jgi:hypothetical protein
MATVILDNGMLAIQFSITKNNYTYNDAIVGNADYIKALTPDEIEAIQTQRFDKWYAVITTPNDEVYTEPVGVIPVGVVPVAVQPE